MFIVPKEEPSDFDKAFMGSASSVITPERAGNRARDIIMSTLPYLFELMMRDELDEEITSMSRQAMGREKLPIEIAPSTPITNNDLPIDL